MLPFSREDAPAAEAPLGEGAAEEGEIVALCAARGEDRVAVGRAEGATQDLSRFLHRTLRLHAAAMEGGGVSELLT